MSKRRRNARYGRDAPAASPGAGGGKRTIALTGTEAWKILCTDAYRPVVQCPEVQICIGVYADLIGAMTIHLMEHGEIGDVRVINELSRRVDIEPARNMTRTVWMQAIVRALMETGNQITVPTYSGAFLKELLPLPPQEVSLLGDPGGNPWDYTVRYRGRTLRPDEFLHFTLNPDPERPWYGRGYQLALRDVVKALRQANATRQALLESPAPSIIVKVDGLTEEFADAEGRKQLRHQFLDASEAGEPWFIPAETFAVEQVKPLSLNDLAIKTNLELDKRTVAAIFGVPPFLIGVGEYKQDEYQHFLTTRVMAMARMIEQELTRALIWGQNWYWRFNPRSLYNYSMQELVNVGKEMVDRAAMRRNELRDWLGLPPDPEMDEIYLLENYLPSDRLGDQKKLKGGEDDGAQDDGEKDDDAD